MTTLVIRGQMNQIRGGARNRWCRMTGNRRGRIQGRMRKLFGRIQCRVGRAKARTGKRFRAMFGH